MKILVIGATGGTGRAVVERLLGEGHEVTAFSRSGDGLGSTSPRLGTIRGDALQPSDVRAAVRGHDAVIVALGITENPLRVRCLGPRHTPIDVRSRGTRNVIAAMAEYGVRRLVVLGSYGTGATRARLRLIDRLFFALLLKPQIEDTERQREAVVQSSLDWVLALPVHLTDASDDGMPFTSLRGDVGRYAISRRSVARFLADAAVSPTFVGEQVALSGVAGRSRDGA
jgi:putative NADH-flavin reductase